MRLQHPDKTKIISNVTKRTGRGKAKAARVGDLSIEILPREGSLKYFGRQISFDKPQEKEIDNRIKAAWRKFHSFKGELLDKNYSLKNRLKLFNGTVTPTMLYGCSTWIMTKNLESKVRSCQRKMLRSILGAKRRITHDNVLESWVEWLKRTTHEGRS